MLFGSGHGSDSDLPEALRATISTIQESSMRYKRVDTVPWMSEGGTTTWSRMRIKTSQVVMSQTFETCMGAIICFNLAIMVFETNQEARCFPEYEHAVHECPFASENIFWISIVNLVLLSIYTVELLVRIYVERCAYWFVSWNQIDVLTVLTGWATTVFQGSWNLSFLRFCRVFRLLRAARVLISIRELYLLISGIRSSLRAIFFGALCLLVVLLLWGILTVQVVHPVNASIKYDGCDRCAAGFSSVQNAVLTLFQEIVAGDSWGMISIPVIEKAPMLFPVLVTILISVSLGVMNLILAVIVERATEARENDTAAKLRHKEELRTKNMIALAEVCSIMDEDGSGTLSLDEMLAGCENSKKFKRLLEKIDLSADDVATIFTALDKDAAGDVSYLQFCQHIDRATKREPQIMMSIVRFAIEEVKTLIQHDVMETLATHTTWLEGIGEALRQMGHNVPNVQTPKMSRNVFLQKQSTTKRFEASTDPQSFLRKHSNTVRFEASSGPQSPKRATASEQDIVVLELPERRHRESHPSPEPDALDTFLRDLESLMIPKAAASAVQKSEEQLKALQASLQAAEGDSSLKSVLQRGNDLNDKSTGSLVAAKHKLFKQELVEEEALLQRKWIIEQWLNEWPDGAAPSPRQPSKCSGDSRPSQAESIAVRV